MGDHTLGHTELRCGSLNLRKLEALHVERVVRFRHEVPNGLAAGERQGSHVFASQTLRHLDYSATEGG